MIQASRSHVLLLADGLVHDDRFTTGAARCVFESARILGDHFRVTILASADDDFGRRPLAEGVHLVRCPREQQEQVRAVAALDQEASIGCILAYLDQTLPLATVFKQSLAHHTPLAYWMQVEPGPMHPMGGLEVSKGHLDAVFLLTRYQARALEEFHPDIAARIHVLGLGIRAPSTAGRATPSASSARRVLFVGRLSFAKGYDIFLAAAEQLEERGLECRYLTVGEFDRDLPHIALLRRNRLLCTGRLEEERYLPPRELWERMVACDVLVLPSRTECVPISILEAWNLRLPVVVGAIPNLVEMDGGRGALLFPASFSGRGFADRVEAALADDVDIGRTIENALTLARSAYSDSTLRAGLVGRIENLLDSKASR